MRVSFQFACPHVGSTVYLFPFPEERTRRSSPYHFDVMFCEHAFQKRGTGAGVTVTNYVAI